MRTSLLAALAVLPFAVACGGGSAFTGIYKVDSASLDPSGCGMGTSTSTAPAYLMIQESSFLGTTILKVSPCGSASADSCTSNFNNLFSQGLLKADGTGGVTSGSTVMGKCEMTDVSVTLSKMGDALTVVSKRSEGTVDGECDSKKFEGQKAGLSCKQQETVQGTRVGDAPKGKDNSLSL